MSQVKIQGNASGTGALTIAAPNTNSNYTLTLPAATTTFVGTDATQTLTNKTLTAPAISSAVMTTMASSVITTGTSIPYTSATNAGTTIDFTSIPSWVKRITVMFKGVSMSSTNDVLVQLGTGGTPATTGYVSGSGRSTGSSAAGVGSTAGMIILFNTAAYTLNGTMVLNNYGSNSWVASHAIGYGSVGTVSGGGDVTLGGTLDIVRIKSASTDTFDAGSINILYE